MTVASGSGRSAKKLSINASRVPASAIATISSIENRLLMTRLVIGAIVGACIGALIGGLAFATLGTDTTATAFLRLENPADLTALAAGASQTTPDNQDNTSQFVAGEIAFLSGDGFAQAVSRKLAQDEPAELNVAQASESSVVTVSASARSSDKAVRTVQVAIDLYREELGQRVDEQLRAILPALADWQQRDPTRTQEIQRVRESVELQAVEARTLFVVQPPTPNHPSSAQWLIGMFLGALVGGAGVAVVLLALRRRSGRGSVTNTLTGDVDGVLLPAVDLALPPREAWTDDQARLARTLYAQCPRTDSDHRVIVVLGASASSGSSVVAGLLERAAAESRPAGHSSSTTQVLDGGAVGDPALTPETIGTATDIVLVARLAEDTVGHVLALRAAAADAVPVVAAITFSAGLFGSRRRKGTTR